MPRLLRSLTRHHLEYVNIIWYPPYKDGYIVGGKGLASGNKVSAKLETSGTSSSPGTPITPI